MEVEEDVRARCIKVPVLVGMLIWMGAKADG